MVVPVVDLKLWQVQEGMSFEEIFEASQLGFWV
jgi:hypothetical protein